MAYSIRIRAYVSYEIHCAAHPDQPAVQSGALTQADIGRLFHFGVNGQILMHFAALNGIEWNDYLQLMRDGIAAHGPVREGIYAITGYAGVDEEPS